MKQLQFLVTALFKQLTQQVGLLLFQPVFQPIPIPSKDKPSEPRS